MAGHYPGILMTGHKGTNTPKFVPPRRGWPHFDPTQTGLCKFGCVWNALIFKSWFSGRGWGQQLFSFQSPAVHWMSQTSSLNGLSCRNAYQTPHSLNCLSPFHWKALFSLKSASSHPLPQNRLRQPAFHCSLQPILWRLFLDQPGRSHRQ